MPESISPKRRPWQLGFSVWLATGLWVGFVPWMPGTIGAIWGIPLTLILSCFAVPYQIALISVGIVAGIPLCTSAARRIQQKDPGCVVWDEIITVPVTFLFISPSHLSNAWIVLTGFALHRVFDITKPPPARYLERLPGGVGIMLDDCVAGIYSCATLHGLIRLMS